MKQLYTLALLFTFGFSSLIIADPDQLSKSELDAIEARVSSMSRSELIDRRAELNIEIAALTLESDNTQSPARKKEAEQKLYSARAERASIQNILLGLIGVAALADALDDDDDPIIIPDPDTIPPVISINSGPLVLVELGDSYTDTGATAIDDVDGVVTVTSSGTVNTDVLGLYTITYTASDSSGNTATASKMVQVIDTTAPVLVVTGASTVSTELGETYIDAGATATDLSGTINVITTGTVDDDEVGTYVLTYIATDSSGNESTATRTVNVVDTTAPVLTVAGDATVSSELGDTYTDAGATATDVSGPITVVTTGSVDTDTVGTYTLTYTATDPSNNSTTGTRTVNVVDTTAPVLTVAGDATVSSELGDTYTDAGATATDLSGDITVVTTGSVDTDTVGTYTLTYTATDPSDNSTTGTRTVNVVDTTAPVLTVAGDATVSSELGDTYTDAGATATDLSGDITVVTTGSVDTDTVGTYTLTYTATDPSDNSTTGTRTVNVVDTTAPVITRTGDYPVRHELGDAYVDGGETATDLSGPITVVTTSTVDVNTIGGYLVTYTATDPSGNVATTTRSVYVADTTAPSITRTGDYPTTVELGSTYTAPDETATDASGSVTVTKTVNGDTDSVGSFLVFYTSTDPSGNEATTTRTVNVVDTTPPVITRTGDYPVTLELGETYTDGGETATDLSGPITVVTTMNGDEDSVGSFLVTYTATDPSGNVATTTRSVYVVDTTAPVITRTGDYPVLHNFGDAYVDGGETATDASGPITIVTTSSVDVNTMGGYLVTYTATDPSGNSTVTTRSVYVADRKAPVFTSSSNFSADENQKAIGTVTATDLFSVTFTISSPYDQIDITSGGVLTFAASENPNYEAKRVYTATVTATDANGNASTQDITVSVNDVGGVDDDPATGTGTSTGTGSSTGTSTGTSSG